MIGRGKKTRLGRSFVLGEGARAARALTNDGTYPHRSIGVTLVREGNAGFVIEIVQSVTTRQNEFVDRAVVLAARRRDLVSFGGVTAAQS